MISYLYSVNHCLIVASSIFMRGRECNGIHNTSTGTCSVVFQLTRVLFHAIVDRPGNEVATVTHCLMGSSRGGRE